MAGEEQDGTVSRPGCTASDKPKAAWDVSSQITSSITSADRPKNSKLHASWRRSRDLKNWFASGQLRPTLDEPVTRSFTPTSAISIDGSSSLPAGPKRFVSDNSAWQPTDAQSTPDPDTNKVAWQWMHRTGWRNYGARTSDRIEAAYQRGVSKVRLKTGKTGTTPMEIFFVDLLQYDPITGNTREVQRVGPDPWLKRIQRRFNEIHQAMNEFSFETVRKGFSKESFAQYQAKRKRLRKELNMTQAESRLNRGLQTFYHRSEAGSLTFSMCTRWCKAVASSDWFFAASMALVTLSSLWIGVDAEYNPATLLYDAPPLFLIVDHVFCGIFILEILIRFGAFTKKRDMFQDSWFAFDATLVALNAFETLIVPPLVVLSGDGTSNSKGALGNFSALRNLRLLRLTRLVRLLRMFPEVVSIVKGIGAAMRSVVITLVLLGVLLYIFGILFKTQSEEYPDIAESYFSSVPEAMWTLLLDGTILDSPDKILRRIGNEAGPWMAFLFLLFIFLSFFTLMNMLIGILCEVVSTVTHGDKRRAEVEYLQIHLLDILDCYDSNGDQELGPQEFEMLMRNVEVHETLARAGVDTAALEVMKDMIFVDGQSVSFTEFIQQVVRFKGSKHADVSDVMELRQFFRRRFAELERLVVTLVHPSEADECYGDRRLLRKSSGLSTGAGSGSPKAMTAESRDNSFISGSIPGEAPSRTCTGPPRIPKQVLDFLGQISQGQRKLGDEVAELRDELREVQQVLSQSKGPPAPPSLQPRAPPPGQQRPVWVEPFTG